MEVDLSDPSSEFYGLVYLAAAILNTPFLPSQMDDLRSTIKASRAGRVEGLRTSSDGPYEARPAPGFQLEWAGDGCAPDGGNTDDESHGSSRDNRGFHWFTPF